MVIIWPFQIKLVIDFKRTQTVNGTSFGHLKHPLDTGQRQIFCQRSPIGFVKDWESEVEMIWNQLNCIGESVGYWPLEVNISWGLPVRRKQQHRIHKTEYKDIRIHRIHKTDYEDIRRDETARQSTLVHKHQCINQKNTGRWCQSRHTIEKFSCNPLSRWIRKHWSKEYNTSRFVLFESLIRWQRSVLHRTVKERQEPERED